MSNCRFEDTGKRLITSFTSSAGSLVTLKESSEKVILCNGNNQKCESFDGSSTVAIAETKVEHYKSCMAINEQGRPTFIAGYYYSSVEILETRLLIKLFKKQIILAVGKMLSLIQLDDFTAILVLQFQMESLLLVVLLILRNMKKMSIFSEVGNGVSSVRCKE